MDICVVVSPSTGRTPVPHTRIIDRFTRLYKPKKSNLRSKNQDFASISSFERPTAQRFSYVTPGLDWFRPDCPPASRNEMQFTPGSSLTVFLTSRDRLSGPFFLGVTFQAMRPTLWSAAFCFFATSSIEKASIASLNKR